MSAQLPGLESVTGGTLTAAAELPAHVVPGRWWAAEHPLARWHVALSREPNPWGQGAMWFRLCGGEDRVEHTRTWVPDGESPPGRACRRCLRRLAKEV
jgi:hypothetical protein